MATGVWFFFESRQDRALLSSFLLGDLIGVAIGAGVRLLENGRSDGAHLDELDSHRANQTQIEESISTGDMF